MFKKELAIKVNAVILFCLGLLDLIRGFMHTFAINWASANIAKIDPHPDALILMGSFGISNFLTGFIYLYIVWKVKEKASFILFLIPVSYVMGVAGMKLSGISMQSEFNGQYMMFIYLAICVLSSLYYAISMKMTKEVAVGKH
ncbi:MAG: hypothetical protein ISR78_01080 [Spirochaetia bacterium]|nr:hypothetical protein [Spirochaetia bacterium]